jgi:PAS domain S-box-containing protein
MVKDGPSGNGVKRENGDLEKEVAGLREKIRELEETLDAIRSGEVDAIVVSKGYARQIYTLEGVDYPYRVLVENIREGALTLSRTGMILYTNTRFADMVNLPPGRVAGTSFFDYICKEDRVAIEDALRKILKKACRTRVRIRQGKGSLPVLISMNPLSSAKNTKISVVVTDRKWDEEQLQLQSRMLDSVGDAVIATDTDHKIIYWNDAAMKTYGWMREDVMGRALADVKIRDILKKEDQKIAAELAKATTGEYIGHHRDGHEFPIYVHDAPVFDDDGKLIAVIGTSHDITDRKQAEEDQNRKNEDLNAAYNELTLTQEDLRMNNEEMIIKERQLNETLAEKEVLLSEIHHRVKNNLAAFISLLSLEGSYEESPAGRELRKDLQNRARTMALIHETLYRTRQYSDVDMDVYISTLVEQVVNSYRTDQIIKTTIEVKGITLDLVRATPIGLIVNELVTNSLKYAFPKKATAAGTARMDPCTIGIQMSTDDGSYLLKVSDNGVGLPAGLDIQKTQTLGLKLINFLARHQLRAKIEINTEKGTEFVFRFKKSSKMDTKDYTLVS